MKEATYSKDQEIEQLRNDKIELQASLDKAVQSNLKSADDNLNLYYIELEKLKTA